MNIHCESQFIFNKYKTAAFEKMGSTPSTPAREGSDDPWWPIENQNLELYPSIMETNHNSNVHQTEPMIAHVESSERTIIIENKSFDETDVEKQISNSSDESNKSDIENVSPETSAKLKNNDRQQSLEEFKEELRIKREMRSNAISELRNEINSLRQQLAEEKEITKQLNEDRNKENLCQICNSIYKSLEHNDESSVEANGESKVSSITLRSQLAELQFSLQNANAEILTLTSELEATRKQAKSLKEVIAASKEIIEIRETELIQVT